MQRRHVLYCLAAAATGAYWLRPDDHGAAHDAYFNTINQLLKSKGHGRPTLIIDLNRLERNCARLSKSIPNSKKYRIVAKSLPSVPLIHYVMKLTHTNRVMSFHQPFINLIASTLPDTDILVGKPMPIKAAETFYQNLDNNAAFNPSQQLQWLIDTNERLLQYQQLAQKLNIQMRINIEIDVGLHRGGLTSTQQLGEILNTIAKDPDHLVFAGLMGYDAHVGHIPGLLESRATSLAKANQIYRSYIELAYTTHPEFKQRDLNFNGAGSPTFRLHGTDSPLNEISVGSALVKPGDFDLDLLSDFEPAAYIATPVIKAIDGLHLPGAETLSQTWALWDKNKQRSYFIYGGSWMASFASPKGLEENSQYEGMINASRSVDLKVDDYLFLRPHQSESVFLQFGDIAMVRDGVIEAWWPVFDQGHVRAS